MKKGITLISIIIYLVLFTTFTAFVISLSSNMNRNVLSDKGTRYIQNEYSKLYVNMLTSAKDSTYYSFDNSKVSFSNGDIYYFNLSDHNVYKNGGILAQDLSSFSVRDVLEIDGINLSDEKLQNSDSLCINVQFIKYGNEISKDIVVSVGDGI